MKWHLHIWDIWNWPRSDPISILLLYLWVSCDNVIDLVLFRTGINTIVKPLYRTYYPVPVQKIILLRKIRADYLSQGLEKKKSISPIPGSSFGWNFLMTLDYIVSLSPVSSSFQIIHHNNLVCFTDLPQLPALFSCTKCNKYCTKRGFFYQKNTTCAYNFVH